MLDKIQLRKELPKVGDILIKKPVAENAQHHNFNMNRSKDARKREEKAYPCVVTYVNEKNLWYQVEFDFGGTKFKQNYNLIDSEYNDEMKKYWNMWGKSSETLRKKTIYDMNRIYDGTSSKPRKVRLDRKFKDVFDITRMLHMYNERHNTNLSYGEYVMLKENKNEFI